MYSASEEDRDIVFFFLLRYEMREVPMWKQEPDTNLLVSMQPAQSASENPVM